MLHSVECDDELPVDDEPWLSSNPAYYFNFIDDYDNQCPPNASIIHNASGCQTAAEELGYAYIATVYTSVMFYYDAPYERCSITRSSVALNRRLVVTYNTRLYNGSSSRPRYRILCAVTSEEPAIQPSVLPTASPRSTSPTSLPTASPSTLRPTSSPQAFRSSASPQVSPVALSIEPSLAVTTIIPPSTYPVSSGLTKPPSPIYHVPTSTPSTVLVGAAVDNSKSDSSIWIWLGIFAGVCLIHIVVVVIIRSRKPKHSPQRDAPIYVNRTFSEQFDDSLPNINQASGGYYDTVEGSTSIDATDHHFSSVVHAPNPMYKSMNPFKVGLDTEIRVPNRRTTVFLDDKVNGSGDNDDIAAEQLYMNEFAAYETPKFFELTEARRKSSSEDYAVLDDHEMYLTPLPKSTRREKRSL